MEKIGCISPVPGNFSFKHIHSAIEKEERDVTTVYFPVFFLYIESKDEDSLFLKMSGSVALFLLESDQNKWRKHVVKDNGKCETHAACERGMCAMINAVLLEYKKVVQKLKI